MPLVGDRPFPAAPLRGRIGVWGELSFDLVVRAHTPLVRGRRIPADFSRHRGGSAANTAVALARLGAPVRFFGVAGEDVEGQWLLEQVTQSIADTWLVRRGRSRRTVSVVEPGGERTMLGDRGDAFTGGPADEIAVERLQGLGAFHLSLSSALRDDTGGVGRLARRAAARMPLTLDAGSAIDLSRDPPLTRALLRDLRPVMLLSNAAEAETLGALRGVPEGVAVHVVKHGAAPAIAFAGDGWELEVPARVVDPVVDTTGAGDAFAAGALKGWMDGATIGQALQLGHATAARVLGHPGGELDQD